MLDIQQYKQGLEKMYCDKEEQYTVISYKVKRFIFSLVPASSDTTIHKLLGAIPTEICLLLKH